MASEVLVNSAVTPTGTPDTTLNNGGTLTSGATSLTVLAVPAYVSAAQFRCRVDDEIMIVTAIGGTGNKVWTVTRGAEGTTAASHADGSNVYLVPTSGGLGQWLNDFGLAATKLTGTANRVLYISSGGVVTELALGAAGTALVSAGASSAPSFALPVLPYLCYEDQKAAGTHGGTFTSGAYRTRTLNTEVVDTDGHGALSSNQITLDAGTYRCRITAPAYNCDSHKARLRNVTDGATVLVGTSEYCGIISSDSVTSASIISGRFTIAAGKALEVQHSCAITSSTDGFGVASNMTEIEIYTRAEFWKEA